MIEQHRNNHFSWQSLVMWIVLSILGYLFAGFLHMPGGGPPIPFNLRDLDLFAGLVGFLFGGITGLVVALLQWIVLKSWTTNARYWIPLNAIGFGLVHALNDAGLFNPLPTSLSLLVGGFIIGLAQAVSLHRTLFRRLLWVAIAATAWLLGFQMAFTLEKVFTDNPLGSLFLAYGMSGLIIGVMTGFAIKHLMADLTSKTQIQTSPEKTAIDRL